MATSPAQHRELAHEVLFRSADVRADLWRRAALDELERMLGEPSSPALTGVADQMLVTSVQRGEHYTAVAVSGPVDARAIRQLAAHLAGLLSTGMHHLVVDLSGATRTDRRLLDLMRRVETRMVDRNGIFELTGLAQPVLHAMEDESLAEVFALYRATLEDDVPQFASWAALRCPQGLIDVAEPWTPARHRSIFDVGAHG